MRKCIVAVCACVLLAGIPAVTVHADLVRAATVQPRADVIKKVYRTYNGKIQYRHWNETQGRWVESYWVTISN